MEKSSPAEPREDLGWFQAGVGLAAVPDSGATALGNRPSERWKSLNCCWGESPWWPRCISGPSAHSWQKHCPAVGPGAASSSDTASSLRDHSGAIQGSPIWLDEPSREGRPLESFSTFQIFNWYDLWALYKDILYRCIVVVLKIIN